jgi:hypothetical protein
LIEARTRFSGAIWSPPPSVLTKYTRSLALPKRGEAPFSVTSEGLPPEAATT